MRRLKRRSAASRRPPALDKSRAADLMNRLRRDAQNLTSHFRLEIRDLAPERANVKRRYGICTADGRIAVRLQHARSGESLKYSSLINTLCHELAHLRHFNHGPRFKAFYFEILEFARREGIYRPGREVPVRWVQMDLFGDPSAAKPRNQFPTAQGEISR